MFRQDQDIFNILLGAVSEGVIVVDEHQRIVEANDAAERLHYCGHNHPSHKKRHELHSPNSQQCRKRLLSPNFVFRIQPMI